MQNLHFRSRYCVGIYAVQIKPISAEIYTSNKYINGSKYSYTDFDELVPAVAINFRFLANI